MPSRPPRLRLRWPYLLSAGAALLAVCAGLWIAGRPPAPTLAPHTAIAAVLPPLPKETRTLHLRGSVRTRGHLAVPRARVSLYSVTPERPQPSRCGGLAPVELFEEECQSAQAEVRRVIEGRQLADVPLAEAQSDDEGLFDFPVPPGQYNLLANAGARGVAAVHEVAPSPEGITLTVSTDILGGFVRAAGGEAPIPNASVALISANPRLVWTTRAAADGSFSVGPVPDQAEWILWAQADGFGSRFLMGDLEDLATITLVPLHAVSGLVTQDEQPVANAEVVLNGERRTRTNARGAYVVPASDCEECKVEARLGTWVGAGESSERVSAATTVVDVPLEPATKVHLRVTDAQTGLPITAQADFEPRDAEWDEGLVPLVPAVQVTLDAPLGQYLAQPVVRGHYLLVVGSPGFLEATRKLDVTEVGGQAVNMALERAPVVAGVVVSTYGAPVAGALVTADELQATSAADGTFVLDGAEPGALVLSASHPAFADTELTVTVPSPQPLRVLMAPVTHLDVKVVDPAGHPVAAARVSADGSQVVTSDESGLAHLQFGKNEANLGQVVAEADGFVAGASSNVHIVAGAGASVEVKLHAGRSIDGFVVDERGKPVPGVELWLRPDDDSQATNEGPAVFRAPDGMGRGLSGLGGAFHLTGLAEGSYTLTVAAAKSADEGVQHVQAGDVDVRVLVPRTGMVTARVTCAGVPVTELSVNDNPMRLAGGVLRYEVGGDESSLVLTGRFVTTVIPVHLAPGGEQDLGDIRVPGLGQVAGQVRQNGQPVPGARITVELPEDRSESGDLFAVTNTEGAFVLSETPGPVHLNIEIAGGTVSQDVVVATGRTTSVDVALPGDWAIMPQTSDERDHSPER